MTLLRLARFDFDIVHVPGKSFYTPNTLSRKPLRQGIKDKVILDEESLIAHIDVITKELESKLETKESKITKAQEEHFGTLMGYTKNG
ncbi:hypothetical protein NQ314_016737 [Rhamnusium bicolor]|uniref:Uncharacterized protein n=1 Tax=Rhamnusium bicolor TaxID=1586634 RepID=A0AAV8WWF5_9CUCU|nr:hypothetical protein NQ314_016737 [Rhamnusium bicolor]